MSRVIVTANTTGHHGKSGIHMTAGNAYEIDTAEVDADVTPVRTGWEPQASALATAPAPISTDESDNTAAADNAAGDNNEEVNNYE